MQSIALINRLTLGAFLDCTHRAHYDLRNPFWSTGRRESSESSGADKVGVRWDAFISYASVDHPMARGIQRFLERYRHPARQRHPKIFLDVTDIRSGELGRTLRDELVGSSKLIVCASRAWADSR